MKKMNQFKIWLFVDWHVLNKYGIPIVIIHYLTRNNFKQFDLPLLDDGNGSEIHQHFLQKQKTINKSWKNERCNRKEKSTTWLVRYQAIVNYCTSIHFNLIKKFKSQFSFCFSRFCTHHFYSRRIGWNDLHISYNTRRLQKTLGIQRVFSAVFVS